MLTLEQYAMYSILTMIHGKKQYRTTRTRNLHLLWLHISAMARSKRFLYR